MKVDAAGRRRIGFFMRFKCRATGTDHLLLSSCPPRDFDIVTIIFWLQAGVWIWQLLLFALILHMMMARHGEVRPELIGVATLLATLIALIDSFMVIRSSWYLHGLEELKRGGLVLGDGWGPKLKNLGFFMVRLLIAAMLSQIVAITAGLSCFRGGAWANIVCPLSIGCAYGDAPPPSRRSESPQPGRDRVAEAYAP